MAKAPAKRRVFKKPAKKRIQVEPPEELEWTVGAPTAPYADIVRSTSNERQFLLHFGQVDPDTQKVIAAAKVVLHPKTAAELLVMLAQQITRHEERFGVKITPEGVVFRIAGEETDDG